MAGSSLRSSGGVGRNRDPAHTGPDVSVVALAVAAFSALLVVVQLGFVAFPLLGEEPDDARAVWAVAATACMLPLYLRQVYSAAQGRTARGSGWSLGAAAIVVFAALPLVGPMWLPTFHVVAVSALMVLRPRWSLLVAAAVVLMPAPLALMLGVEPYYASWYLIAVVFRGSASFVLVWLVGAIRRLEVARTALAEAALAVERLRIDDEVQRELGTALDAIARRGQALLAEQDPNTIEAGLRALVEGSRHTLAGARRLTSTYRESSLRGVLDSTVSLLTAAGIPTEVVASTDALGNPVDPSNLASLRSLVSGLLRDRDAERCVITVANGAGQPSVGLQTGRGVHATGEAVAP